MNFFDIRQDKSIYADGIHDDTKAIQSCLDKMKDGGTIFFPDGAGIFFSAESAMLHYQVKPLCKHILT